MNPPLLTTPGTCSSIPPRCPRGFEMAWKPVRLGAAVILMTIPTSAALAAEADDVATLQREVDSLKAEVAALKEALAALQAQAAPAAPAPAQEQPAPPTTTSFPYPATGAPARSQNLMNPAISAVFQFIGNTFTDRQDSNGFDLSEAEIAFES